uniref:PspC domain-containing protein n=1 Tax=Flavobacterium sp. TaxID=239 RepID=UPI004049621E
MNKTVNINIGGIFFHIDEDAYQKLSKYLDAIKRSLKGSSGQEEIMKDIEMRIAEILSNAQKSNLQVIVNKDIEAVISVMGQPEDYVLEDSDMNTNKGYEQEYSYQNHNKNKRKLYRDMEHNVLGGVGAGLGYYLGVDTIWVRLVMLFLLFGSGGTATFIYILLWILVPVARTTSEKLEMKGEPVNISNIEKKVREGFERVSDEVKNLDYDRMGRNAQTGAEKLANGIGEFFGIIFKLFAKIVGVFIVFISVGMLISLLVGMFTIGTTTFFSMPWQTHVNSIFAEGFPLWLIVLLGTLAAGIPTFMFLILGLKILVPNMKPVGNIAKYTLLALWIISIATLITFGIKQATESAFNNRVFVKKEIAIQPNDTLNIRFKSSELYSSNGFNDEYEIVEDLEKQQHLYSKLVDLKIESSDDASSYIKIEKKASGSSFSDARERAENIDYQFQFENNKLILDDFFITNSSLKQREQRITITLYLPKNLYINPDNSVAKYLNQYQNSIYFNKGYDRKIYQMLDNGIKCSNCDEENVEVIELNNDNNDNKTTTVIIDENGVKVEKKTTDSDEFRGLKIDSNGVIIKTN